MDIFVEKILQKKKDFKDYLFTFGIFLGAVVLMFSLPLIVSPLAIILDVAVAYAAYRLMKTRNKEYEYSVTNGEIDIDIITDRKKRKKVFSANCKEFEILEKLNGLHYREYEGKMTKKIQAVSSMNAEDIYYFVLNREKERIMVYFEPNNKMIDAFKNYIPSKVFE